MIVNKELAISTGHKDKDLWETPDWLFAKLNVEYRFTLDPCCELHTAKARKFYTPKENGLIQSWRDEVVFVNPPYSRGNIDLWVKKCWEEAPLAKTIVGLLPVSTSSQWFHKYVLGKSDITFIEGRVRFRGAPYTAPFSSMIVKWNWKFTTPIEDNIAIMKKAN